MIKSDFHTHSKFSGDSKTPMRDMIEGAISQNLNTLCFTEHNDPDFIYDENDTPGMFDLDTSAYLKSADKYKELYRDKIQILNGVELGIQEHLSESLSDYIKSYPFDFVIASSHLCDGMDPYKSAFFDGRTVKESFRAYFSCIDRNLRTFNDFDVYGHLDYVVRYAPEKNKEYNWKDYTEIFESIFKYLIQNGKGIEVNSGGFRHRLGLPNPAPELLKFYRQCGGEIITVGSDAHSPEYIASDFAKIETILIDCGFRYYTTFSGRNASFHKI